MMHSGEGEGSIRLSWRASTLAAVAAVSACSGAAAGSGPVRLVSANLTGKAEAGKGSARGSGTAVLRLNTKTGRACWTIRLRGLAGPLSAHVAKAPPGKEGPVVIPLGGRFAATGCVRSSRKTVAGVARTPRGYYVDVLTRGSPDGAVRGQLHR